MNTSAFYELRKRLYSCAAAGCSNVSEDFRLKKALEDLAPLAQANKSFARLGDMCGRLFSDDAPAPLLADCIALADALAVAQGGISDNSETEKAGTAGRIPEGNVPYSRINALCELVRKDSPKLIELPPEDAALAADPRVIAVFAGMSNRNSYLLESFFRKITAASGDMIVPLLKSRIDVSDPKESGVRIKYISMAAGDKERELYISTARNTEASNDLRAAALEALGDAPENKDILLEIYNTSKGKVKNTALAALAGTDCPECEDIFKKLTAKYKPSYDQYIARSGGKICTEFAVKLIKEEDAGAKNARTAADCCALIANKPDADEGFMILKARGEQYIGPLNNTLIGNLCHTERRAEFEGLIHRLFSADKKSFRKAELFTRLADSPETAFDDIRPEDIVPVLEILKNTNLVYSENTGYYFISVSSDRLRGIELFKDIPAKMFELICTVSADKEPNDLRMSIFFGLMHSCKPADREMICRKGCEFAAAAIHKTPDFAMLNFIHTYGSAADSGDYRGLITDYIMYCCKHDIFRGYYSTRIALGMMPIPLDVRLAELEQLLKKLKNPLNIHKHKDDYIKAVQDHIDNNKLV